jgi:hypothetical protein
MLLESMPSMLQRMLFTLSILCLLVLSMPHSRAEEGMEAADHAETEAEQGVEPPFKQVQLETYRLTLLDFLYFKDVHQIEEMMFSIPGMKQLTPFQESAGLISYEMGYSGSSELLIKALVEVFPEERFELTMREIGEKAWEISLKPSIAYKPLGESKKYD